MSINGLRWQVLNWPFGFGLNQQTDKRARPAPALDIAKDVQVDEQGGLQTRLPYTVMSNNIAGGGTLTNCRRLFVSGDELCVLTKSALYSYDEQLAQWVLKATHLAAKIDESPVFISTGDQVETDRAELSGRIYYAWTDTSKVYVAVVDKATGATWMSPSPVGGTGTRPRLVALTTVVLLFWHAGTDGAPGNIRVYVIDPTTANPTTLSTALAVPTVSGTPLAAASSGSYYDTVKIPGSDSAIFVARRAVNTSYEIAKISNAGAVTASTKARTCTGPIAVSVDPTGATAQVLRANAVAMQGDRITVSSLADAATGQAIGTITGATCTQVAACHRSVQDSGAYRCYVFWDEAESVTFSPSWLSRVNYVDTAGTIGTEAEFVYRLGIASRAFDYDGRVYVWGAFGGQSDFTGANPALFRAQLQNSFFLYRDDAFIVAKAAMGRAGGFRAATGHLPGVALVDGTTTYAFCGDERRIIPLGGAEHSGYADRGPRDFRFTFDSDQARRTVRLGRTVFIAAGELLQYDGTGLFELGFHVYPWTFGTFQVAAGNLADGVYTHQASWRWENAVGEQERSTSATAGQVTISGGPNGATVTLFVPLYQTHKTGTGRVPAVEMWRTQVNPVLDAPFYLVTSKDPASTSNPNRYLSNDTTASVLPTFNDEFADSTLTTKEQHPENEGVLESLAPPACSIIAATDTRIFIAGVAGDPDRVWYSRQRAADQLPSFNDLLIADVPQPGGEITAIAVREGALIVWRETACYLLPGYGFTNTGDGQNFGPAQVISSDIGAVNMESVALTDQGHIFKSSKGWYILDRSFSLRYIGGAVVDYDAEEPLAVTVIEAQHQVRVLTANRMLVLDTQSGQWFEWAVLDGLDAVMWKGAHVYLATNGPSKQSTTYTGLTYGMDVETAWIKLDDLQGAAAVRKVQPIGEWRSAHALRVRIAYNYRVDAFGEPLYVDDKPWVATADDVGDLLQVKHGPKRPRCQSIKVRLTAIAAGAIATNTDFFPAVPLSVGVWTATLTGYTPGTVSIGLVLAGPGETNRIEIRDHEQWDGSAWISDPNNCGIKVTGNDTTATVQVGALEFAINDVSNLVTVTSGHATPSSTLNFAAGAVDDVAITDPFSADSPTGEALKLTGLGLEVGSEGGLYRSLPKAQQQ